MKICQGFWKNVAEPQKAQNPEIRSTGFISGRRGTKEEVMRLTESGW